MIHSGPSAAVLPARGQAATSDTQPLHVQVQSRNGTPELEDSQARSSWRGGPTPKVNATQKLVKADQQRSTPSVPGRIWAEQGQFNAAEHGARGQCSKLRCQPETFRRARFCHAANSIALQWQVKKTCCQQTTAMQPVDRDAGQSDQRQTRNSAQPARKHRKAPPARDKSPADKRCPSSVIPQAKPAPDKSGAAPSAAGDRNLPDGVESAGPKARACSTVNRNRGPNRAGPSPLPNYAAQKYRPPPQARISARKPDGGAECRFSCLMATARRAIRQSLPAAGTSPFGISSALVPGSINLGQSLGSPLGRTCGYTSWSWAAQIARRQVPMNCMN